MLYKFVNHISLLLFSALIIVIGGSAAFALLVGIIYVNLKVWAIAIEQGSIGLGFGACVFNVFTMLCFNAINKE